MNFDNVDLEFFAEAALKNLAELVDLLATLTDHDTNLGGVYRDFDAVCRALDFDAGHTSAFEALHDQTAELEVFVQLVSVIAF